MYTHSNTHISPLPAVAHACLHSQACLMKLLKQILERNSICRGDERCDRGEREERRMKGQEEKEGRVAAPGLIVHSDHPFSALLFVPLHIYSQCMCSGNYALNYLSFTNGQGKK